MREDKLGVLSMCTGREHLQLSLVLMFVRCVFLVRFESPSSTTDVCTFEDGALNPRGVTRHHVLIRPNRVQKCQVAV